MAGSSKSPLTIPPFPTLGWDGHFWAGRIVLGSWRGFQCRLGHYAAESSSAASDGTAALSVLPPGGVAEQPPSAAQANAFRYLLENEDAIRDTLVAAIFEAYPGIREKLLGRGNVDESDIPVLGKGAGQLRSHIGLSIIHVLQVVKDDAAYVGFEFGCTWDEEHGLGILTHQGRIVELPDRGVDKVGQADIASEEWLAEEDAQLPEPVAEEDAPSPESAVEEDVSPFAKAQRAGPRCSFCGQTADMVGPFVQGMGPKNEGGVFICGPCVERLRTVFVADAARMATRECLRCHAVISKEAARCPHCGFPR
jgi:hypothetical protein